MNLDTKPLIEKSLAGDRNAFKALIEANQRLVMHVVYKMVSNHSDVEDICQDVFVKVYQNLSNFQFNSKLSTWIAKIAFNTTINFLEKKKVPLFDDFSPEDVTLDHLSGNGTLPDEFSEQGELSGILQDQIDHLPVQFRTILTLYHLDEMSYKEIGGIMDLPEGTVKSYLFRARKLLKDSLLSKYEEKELVQ